MPHFQVFLYTATGDSEIVSLVARSAHEAELHVRELFPDCDITHIDNERIAQIRSARISYGGY